MKIKILLGIATIGALGASGYWLLKKPKLDTSRFFILEKAEVRDISQVVTASGTVGMKDPLKIGSVSSGIVTNVFVEENAVVKKGQPLAAIDPGTGTFDLQKAELTLRKAQEELTFTQRAFKRQMALFESGQLAREAFERVEKELRKTELDHSIALADLEKQRLDVENRTITAISDGIITAIWLRKGEGVTGTASGATSVPLFELAPDITHMEATLDIDESDIGYVHPGQTIRFAINAFPGQHFESKLHDISFSPKLNRDSGSGSSNFYRGSALLENSTGKLRPGMALHGTIFIAQEPTALSVKNMVFQIKSDLVIKVAQLAGRTATPIEQTLRKELKVKTPGTKFVWVAQGNVFVEKSVIIGISDGTYTHIKEGLAPTDEVITSIQQSGEMDALYKKMFRGAL